MTIEKWIESNEPLTLEMFNTFKSSILGVDSKNQMLFLKKVMSEIHKGQITLTVEELLEIKTFSFDTYVEFGKPKEIDYTLDLVLQTLQFINNKGHFPKDYKENYELVRNIADFIADYLKNDLEHLSKINLLFDSCPERTAIVRKKQDEFYIELRGKNYKVYDIYQGYSIKNQDKSGYGDLIVHHQKGIYTKGIVCLLEVIERKPNKKSDDYLKYGKNIIYNDKKYPFKWKKNTNTFLIMPDESPVESCEGRLSEIECNLSSQKFWWCYGRKCMKANQNDHSFEEWKNYTLRDFLKILGLPFEDKGYYIFVSEINRLNRLIDRIKCKKCSKVLRPSKQSNFGFYRVSHFHCNNKNCNDYRKEIYLTHCLNSKCTNVIDSRISERCENGLIICDACGSCCSNEQFIRRADGLKVNGRSIPQSLISLIEKKKGHWEKAECFCYRCKSKMIEKGGNYKCEHCQVIYNRNNVYIRQNKNYQNIVNQRSKIKPSK
ncbi:hypothetical protein M0D21_10215 [Aquimarina sp. D1M17]|uniref:hypothetical protein n=1 Tax=Aquimarina acroporae TaxID=2937283 RepID=UPI0020C02BBD|nr:hypothetical protein [Aquimarina acroporae]MCK8521943.1 hypothetical protein [Aquimarina acroporae]